MENLAGYALEVNIGGGDALEVNIGDVRMLPGADGITPTIGDNGNWYLGETDTGKPSRGEKGDKGDTGPAGAVGAAGKNGYTPVRGTDYWTEADIASIQRYIDDNAQPKLIAGENITIAADGKTISATGGGSVPKPLTYDYMPEGYPTKAMGTVTLIEEQELAFASGAGGYIGFLTTHALEIVEGQTYTVNWDGTEYECAGFVFGNEFGLGNLSLMGSGDDTGEPFLCSYGYADDAGGVVDMFFTLDTSPTHTVSVKTTAETVIPMAEEFIPKMNVSAFTNDAGYLTLDTLPKYGGEIV